jgi:hypothetical protein
LASTPNTSMAMVIENLCDSKLWFARRAYGKRHCWASILINNGLQRTLLMPNHTRPIAYLCRGYITELSDKQILEKRLAIEYEVE